MALQGQMQVETKTGNVETRKYGKPEMGKSGTSGNQQTEINQKSKAIPTIRDSCIRLELLLDVETRKR